MDLLCVRRRAGLRCLLAAALIGASGSAAAQAAPVLRAGGVISRAPTADLSSYSRAGLAASAELTRSVPVQYRTASNKALELIVGDKLKPSPANIAKHLAKRIATPGGLAVLAGAAAAAAFMDYLDNDGTRPNATTGTPERVSISWYYCSNGSTSQCIQSTGALGSLGSAPRFQSWYEAGSAWGREFCRASESGSTPVDSCAVTAVTLSGNPQVSSHGFTVSYTTTRTSSTLGTVTTNGSRGFGVLGSGATVTRPLTQDEIANRLQGLSADAPPYDASLDAATVPGGDPYTVADGDTGELTAAGATTAPYGQSTTTNPDGSTSTTSKTDTVTAESTGQGPAAENKATTKETTTVVVVTPEGTTTTETEVEPEPEQGNPGTGTPTAPDEVPTGTLSAPGLSADTYAGALAAFRARVEAAPIAQVFADFSAAFSSSAAACPTTSFNALGAAFTFDSHCPIVETYKSVISTAFLFAWTILGFIIFFRRS